MLMKHELLLAPFPVIRQKQQLIQRVPPRLTQRTLKQQQTTQQVMQALPVQTLVLQQTIRLIQDTQQVI
ncbi:MAG: hypothetical protein VR68_13640 [Peptococcaceae bacterium BRH_c4a]|nr:MAG: hypothetical protein VR68_13640 [Peptococcaceae bacterium BRH_c4a]